MAARGSPKPLVGVRVSGGMPKKCGVRKMVLPQSSKLKSGVRFSYPAPLDKMCNVDYTTCIEINSGVRSTDRT